MKRSPASTACNVVSVMPGREKIARAALELMRRLENGTAIVQIDPNEPRVPRGLEKPEERT